jgi:AhpC/TSA family
LKHSTPYLVFQTTLSASCALSAPWRVVPKSTCHCILKDPPTDVSRYRSFVLTTHLPDQIGAVVCAVQQCRTNSHCFFSSKAIRLGNIVPDFGADTTHGPFESFHEWKKGKWAILFSHPADFTPVCTTEIGRLALKYDELEALDCLVATLSVDPVKSHNEWLEDVVAHCENKIEIKFPIIG